MDYEGRTRWKIKEGAKIYIPRLYARGFILHLITARSDRQEVLNLVETIESYLEVKFTKVELSYKMPKGKISSDLGCHYMIDDYPEYIRDCEENNVKPILLQNQARKFKRMHPKWTVCSNWKEIYEYLLSSHPEHEEIVEILE